MSARKRTRVDTGEDAHAGGGQAERPRYSKVDQETLNYFEEISNHFNTLEDDEERSLVADNALGEALGNEARVASDAACSRVLEKLIPFVSLSALTTFVNACSEGENLGATCTSGPFGSHVLEKAVAELGKRARHADEDSFALIEQVLKHVTEAVSDNLYDMAVHKYATHVARRLLCVLCGRDVAPAARKQQQAAAAPSGGDTAKGPQHAQQHALSKGSKAPGGLAAKLGAAGAAGGAEGAAGTADYPALLERVFATVLSEGWEEVVGELRGDSFGGPLLQALLRAAVCLGNSDIHHKMILRALGVSGPDSLTADSLHTLMKDRAGSHLMEVVFETSPDDLYQKISTLSFKGHLLDLTRHPTANFAVQAGIAALKKPAQLKRVFEDLRPHLASLLRSRRAGVAAALAGAAGRLETLQADVAAALWHALGAGPPGAAPPLDALLTLDTNVNLGGGGRLSTLGCALASTLLRYPPADCKQFAEALAALPPSKLAAVAKDSGGCRVLEAYIEGAGASPKKRRALLQALAGSYAAAASQPAGNYFVEKCYALADMKEKELIARELAAAEQRLAATYRGLVLLRRCNVEAIKKGSDTWQQRVAAADAVRREFEDLFAEGGDVEASAPAQLTGSGAVPAADVDTTESGEGQERGPSDAKKKTKKAKKEKEKEGKDKKEKRQAVSKAETGKAVREQERSRKKRKKGREEVTEATEGFTKGDGSKAVMSVQSQPKKKRSKENVKRKDGDATLQAS